jgi:hypothetical protein
VAIATNIPVSGSSSSGTSNTSASGNLSIGEIIGIASGVVGAIAGVIAAWFGYKKYKSGG